MGLYNTIIDKCRKLKNKSLKLNEKQAAAAAGQIVLAKAWKNIFVIEMFKFHDDISYFSW